MKFKVGDKVKFLDEAGGGTVTAIVDDKMVKIETDEGFEMPVMMSELILDYRNKTLHEESGQTNPNVKPKEELQNQASDAEEISDISTWKKPKEEEGVYLVFEPHDQQWLLMGPVSIFLVNHTDTTILYNLFLNINNSIQGVDYGSIPAHSKKNLDVVSREEIENWSKGTLQIMIHEDQPKQIYLPIHTDINIKINRFFKEGSYVSNSLVNGKAVVSTIALKSMFHISNDVGKYDDQPQKTKNVEQKEKALIDQYKTSFGEAVVDLHIGEIVDNIAGLESRDIFKIQLDHFQKTLDSAIANDYKKVTFIHGIGNGILKNAIIDYFKLHGNEQADIIKFGVGSLEVSIKNTYE